MLVVDYDSITRSMGGEGTEAAILDTESDIVLVPTKFFA